MTDLFDGVYGLLVIFTGVYCVHLWLMNRALNADRIKMLYIIDSLGKEAAGEELTEFDEVLRGYLKGVRGVRGVRGRDRMKGSK